MGFTFSPIKVCSLRDPERISKKHGSTCCSNGHLISYCFELLPLIMGEHVCACIIISSTVLYISGSKIMCHDLMLHFT